jgi:hypothetical protein
VACNTNNILKYIFGIDVGPLKSAYIFLSLDCKNYIKIIDKNYLNNDIMKHAIVSKHIKYNNIEFIIETIVSYGMPMGQTTINTSIFAGRFFQMVEDINCMVNFISRPEIKLNLTHSRRSKQKNVKQALKNRFGEFGTKKNPNRLYELKNNLVKGGLDHVWSALAVAVTYIDQKYGLAL